MIGFHISGKLVLGGLVIILYKDLLSILLNKLLTHLALIAHLTDNELRGLCCKLIDCDKAIDIKWIKQKENVRMRF